MIDLQPGADTLPGMDRQTAQDIRSAIRRRYTNKRAATTRYIIADEVRVGLGFHTYSGNNARSIDTLVIDTYRDFRRTAFEVKVSRSDFLSDLAKPDKHTPALALCHDFYWIAPKGMISPDEIPAGMGLMEVDPKGRTRIKVKSDYNMQTGIDEEFAYSIMRRLI